MGGAVFLIPIVDILGNVSSGFVHGGSKKKKKETTVKNNRDLAITIMFDNSLKFNLIHLTIH